MLLLAVIHMDDLATADNGLMPGRYREHNLDDIPTRLIVFEKNEEREIGHFKV